MRSRNHRRLVRSPGIHAEHRHLAAVAGQEALEDLDRGGLTCAVRAKKGEDLAPLDVKADVVDGLDGAVGLSQVLDTEGERHAPKSPPSLDERAWSRRARAEYRCESRRDKE